MRARLLYRWLLRAYPPGFRAAYGNDLEQLFADVWRAESASDGSLLRVWWWAVTDTLTRAPGERMKESWNGRWLLLLGMATLFGVGIGSVDSSPHWDDTGITVAILVATTGVLGLVHPRGAWVWALAVGIWIPLLNVLQTHNAGSLLALPFAFIGAYAGAFGRRLLTSAV